MTAVPTLNSIRSKLLLGMIGAVLCLLASNPVFAQSIPPPVPDPVDDGMAVYYNGLKWVWASPCSGGCSVLPNPLPYGYRFPTIDEFAGRPAPEEFLIIPLITGTCTYPNECKCAAIIFDPRWNHCDAQDLLAGRVARIPDGGSNETLLVKDLAPPHPPQLTGIFGITNQFSDGSHLFSMGDDNYLDYEEWEAAIATLIPGGKVTDISPVRCSDCEAKMLALQEDPVYGPYLLAIDNGLNISTLGQISGPEFDPSQGQALAMAMDCNGKDLWVSGIDGGTINGPILMRVPDLFNNLNSNGFASVDTVVPIRDAATGLAVSRDCRLWAALGETESSDISILDPYTGNTLVTWDYDKGVYGGAILKNIADMAFSPADILLSAEQPDFPYDPPQHELYKAYIEGYAERINAFFTNVPSFAYLPADPPVTGNHPPVADAGTDMTFEAIGQLAWVSIDGVGSSDPDGDQLSYFWTTPSADTGPVDCPDYFATFGQCPGGEIFVTQADGTRESIYPASAYGAELGQNLEPLMEVGTHVITLTVDDGKGGIATDTVTITVAPDTTPPVVHAPGDVTVPATGELTEVTLDPLNSGYASDDDLFNQYGTYLEATPENTGPFPVGTTDVIWSATDSVGNKGTATQKVTVTDDVAPVITPPADITTFTDPGQPTAVVSFPEATATDNTVNVTVEQTAGPASGSAFPIGTSTVTWTATDSTGNSASASMTVTVEDNEDPVINTVDITVNTDAGQPDAVVTFPDATASDNSGSVSVSQTGGPVSGSSFPIGTTTITWTATDPSLNSASASMTVTVADNEAPFISAPADVTQDTDPGQPTAVVLFADATVTDNSGSVTLARTGLASGSAFPIGASTVTWTATDASGNTASASLTVTVVDNETPVISAPADITQNTDPGQSTAVVSFGSATATDNSGSVGVTQTAGPASGSAFPLGTSTVTWTATDAAGNSVSASMSVTVVDNEAPVVTAPADISVEATGTSTTVNLGTATATDNVGVVTGPTADNTGPFTVGTHTITWSATDAAGNTGTATQTVTVFTVEQAIDNLSDDISDLDLPAGTESGMQSKLDSAGKALADDNPNNDKSSINSLNALINSIEAQRGKKISDADADELIARLRNLIGLIE